MKLTKYSQLRHGMKVTCKIGGKQINDAKLSKDKKGEYYICQNEIYGEPADDMLGYEYSWWITDRDGDADEWDSDITDLESVEEKRKFYVGQRVRYDGDDYITAGEYTIVELTRKGAPLIKEGSDLKYNTYKYLLWPHKCYPIEEKKKPEQWTPHYTRGGDKLEENRITIDGKEYTPEELKTICNRYRSVLAAHSKYFPSSK